MMYNVLNYIISKINKYEYMIYLIYILVK